MERYTNVYYEEIKERLEKYLDLEELEIYTFTNDANQYYSRCYPTKILKKIAKRIIYQIILGILEQQKIQNGHSR